jgi:hypothetical protein
MITPNLEKFRPPCPSCGQVDRGAPSRARTQWHRSAVRLAGRLATVLCACHTIVENTMVENTIVENTIVENTIVENTIVENTMVENTIVDNTNVDYTIVENTIVDNKPLSTIIPLSTILSSYCRQASPRTLAFPEKPVTRRPAPPAPGARRGRLSRTGRPG